MIYGNTSWIVLIEWSNFALYKVCFAYIYFFTNIIIATQIYNIKCVSPPPRYVKCLSPPEWKCLPPSQCKNVCPLTMWEKCLSPSLLCVRNLCPPGTNNLGGRKTWRTRGLTNKCFINIDIIPTSVWTTIWIIWTIWFVYSLNANYEKEEDTHSQPQGKHGTSVRYPGM